MLIEWALFLALSAVALTGAAMMLLTMSMYRAGLFLMVSFLALAGMFFLLQADLIAVIQIMMNVGGMLIMILFMVMMMIDPGGEMMWDMKRQMKLPGPGAFSMSMPRGEPPTAGEQESEAEQQHSPASAEAGYTCPMHPEVRSDEPGACPKCGMDLVPVRDPAAASGSAEPPQAGDQDAVRGYTCPMHPEVRSDAPGSCPICGMQLVPVPREDTGNAPAEAEGEYTCPMHPEVVADKPGSCPKCGMDLVPASPAAGAEPPDAAADADGEKADVYTCPMHPEIRSDRPGPCPKCGMDLVPAHDSAPTPVGTQEAGGAVEYTCPMHPEVRSDEPGSCPKCAMDLVPATSESPTVAAEEDAPAMHGGHQMSPAAHHQMMVGMAMSTEQLPWAIGIGVLSGGSLAALVAWTPWRTVPRGPVGDATAAVGELLLSRYMMAFEGAAMLILAGIAAGVILGRREGRPPRAGSDSADGAVVHSHEGEVAMQHANDQQTPGASGVWTCPMHLEVRSDGPGKCPKCGMDLVPAESLGDQGGSSGR